MDDHAYLEFREGTSDKFYRILATQLPSGDWVTTAWWGRRGSNGQTQIKYMGPSEMQAKFTVDEFANQKRNKGYVDALDPLTPAASTTKPSPAPTGTRIAGTAFVKPASPVFPQLGVPRFPAMKAKEADVAWDLLDHRFVMEEKFDGHRAGLTFNPDGTIVVRNVYGEDKGKIENMPHIKSHLESVARGAHDNLYAGTLIDGELVGLTLAETTHLLGGSGRTDPRLRFVAFDLPFYAGRDMRDEEWIVRRITLDGLLTGLAGPVEIAPTYPATYAGVEGIWARGGEGVIIKSADSLYVPAGRADWVKVKEHHTADAVVTGWEPGNGKYNNQIGALKLSQYKGGALTEVTKVSGMDDATRKHASTHWTAWEGTVIEFEYQAKTPTGSYRHPRFVRRRLDKQPTDCTWEASA